MLVVQYIVHLTCSFFTENLFIWQTHLRAGSGLGLEQFVFNKQEEGRNKANRPEWKKWENSLKALKSTKFYNRCSDWQVMYNSYCIQEFWCILLLFFFFNFDFKQGLTLRLSGSFWPDDVYFFCNIFVIKSFHNFLFHIFLNKQVSDIMQLQCLIYFLYILRNSIFFFFSYYPMLP